MKTTTKRRRQPARTQAPATDIRTVTVDPRVMEAAREVRRPGEKLVIVSETCVRLVNSRV
jgi:hypothetical protein